MLTTKPTQQIFLATEPVDMRGGFDRLAGRVVQAGLDLYGGHLFVFVSRRRSHLKILTWDGSGLVILYKRLSRGRFVLPDTDPSVDMRATTLDPAALATLLDGVAVVGRRGSRSASRASPRIDTGPKL